MTKKRFTAFFTVLLLALGVTAVHAAGSAKVKVCHIPPGEPANFHTITIGENALNAHLAHGDLAGSCFANGEALCDDGNACTVDSMDEVTETCSPDHPPVDCDDGLLCTTDSCDPASGCQSAPIVCNDGDNCTVDACNPFDGQCTGSPIDCGPLGVCLADTGACDFPCDGITCDPIDQCHEAGECVLPGECVGGAAVADGTACDDGDAGTTTDQCTGGVCAGEAGGGCFTAFDHSATQNNAAAELDCQQNAGCPGTSFVNCTFEFNDGTANAQCGESCVSSGVNCQCTDLELRFAGNCTNVCGFEF